MWQRKNRGHSNNPNFYISRSSLFIDRDFQMKYVIYVVGTALLGMFFLLSPLFIYLKQNYQIFKDLAYTYSPNLVEHLDRESQQITAIIIATFLGVFIFLSILSLKVTTKIIGPVKILRNHLKFLSRGIWSQKPITIRENDEFKDLIDAYNYFYKSFQNQIQKDLVQLKNITVDINDRTSCRSLEILINEKHNQLNIQYKTERIHKINCPILKIDTEKSTNLQKTNKVS